MTGQQLQTIRDELGLTQEELAELLGISRRTLCRFEEQKTVPNYIALSVSAIEHGDDLLI